VENYVTYLTTKQ